MCKFVALSIWRPEGGSQRIFSEPERLSHPPKGFRLLEDLDSEVRDQIWHRWSHGFTASTVPSSLLAVELVQQLMLVNLKPDINQSGVFTHLGLLGIVIPWASALQQFTSHHRWLLNNCFVSLGLDISIVQA